MARVVEYLRVKNWEEFQHYKFRNPPWIKLHRRLLDDYEFSCLQDASKAHLMLIWLFASQSDGLVPNNPRFLKMKLGLSGEPNLKWLIDHGLLIPEQDASNALAGRVQSADTEKSREEKSREHAIAVLKHLNEKANKDYKPVNGNLSFIAARLEEGASVEECRAVIDRKCREWAGGEMDKFLRPATLFNATKFAQYQGERDPAPTGESI